MAVKTIGRNPKGWAGAVGAEGAGVGVGAGAGRGVGATGRGAGVAGAGVGGGIVGPKGRGGKVAGGETGTDGAEDGEVIGIAGRGVWAGVADEEAGEAPEVGAPQTGHNGFAGSVMMGSTVCPQLEQVTIVSSFRINKLV